MTRTCISWTRDPAASWYRVRVTDEGPLRHTDATDERLLEDDGHWRLDAGAGSNWTQDASVSWGRERATEGGVLRFTEEADERLLEDDGHWRLDATLPLCE